MNKMPKEMKAIYTKVLKYNKVPLIERLNWAFPETYKLYLCSPEITSLNWYHGPIWSPPTGMASAVDFANDAMDYIEDIYLLRPGEVRSLRT